MHAPRREPFHNASSQEASAFDLALFSGGDERVFLDPATGRTKYGTPRGPAEDEIWLSSSTASAISPRGYAAAATTWQNLVSGKQTLSGCSDSVRDALLRLFGIDGAEGILAGSGTEAILIATAIASRLLGLHLTAIVVGCAETGRGVRYAAEGRHFLHHATFADVTPGAHLDGMQAADIAIETVDIRDRNGALRTLPEIDAELTKKAEAARHANRNVIIHRLDGSKTGQSAPSLDCLAELRARWPQHLLVLADCCQLRSTPDHIRALLGRGFIVTLTGSKFAGGPSFCGALLLPPEIAGKLATQALPVGLLAYSAQLDWPSALRKSVARAALPAANIGLVLRWHAALAEIDTFFARDAGIRDDLLERFHQAAVAEAAHTAGVTLLQSTALAAGFGETIITFVLRRPDGSTLDMEAAATLQRSLQGDGFHLGQPVEIGGAGALRLCASMPLVNRLADKIATGTTPAVAMTPIQAAIAALFRRIGALLAA